MLSNSSIYMLHNTVGVFLSNLDWITHTKHLVVKDVIQERAF